MKRTGDKTIHLWTDFEVGKADEIPADIVTQKVAFVGRSGSGKTHAASVLVEQLLKVGHQVIVLDWVGNWYGLRLAKNGRDRSGLAIYLFGGEHGDIPLEPEGGELTADVLVDHRASAVVDISEWSKNKRNTFATAFAERLLLKKRKDKSPLHLVVEEAQAFAPQRTVKGDGRERLLGAFEELAKVGRNRGIGISLLTQRPQAVHKDVLNQTELLVCFQLNAAHEREAIKDWVAEQGADKSLLADLPKLKPGEAVVWSPMWLEFLGRVRIVERETFDASKTPELGDRAIGEVAPLDLGALKEAMAATIDRRVEDDPKTPKKTRDRIAALEREAATLQAALQEANRREDRLLAELAVAEIAAATSLEPAPHIATQLLEGLQPAAHEVGAGLDRAIELVEEALDGALDYLRSARRLADDLIVPLSRTAPAHRVKPAKSKAALTGAAGMRAYLDAGGGGRKGGRTNGAAAISSTPASSSSSSSSSPQLVGGARRMLTTLAAWRRIRPLTQAQLGTLAKMAPSGGAFQRYMSTLRFAGFVNSFEKSVEITQAGLDFVGPIDTIQHDAYAIAAAFGTRLGKGAREMLSLLVSTHPRAWTKDQLADSVGMAVEGGSFQRYLSALTGNHLAERTKGGLIAAPWMFGKSRPGVSLDQRRS